MEWRVLPAEVRWEDARVVLPGQFVSVPLVSELKMSEREERLGEAVAGRVREGEASGHQDIRTLGHRDVSSVRVETRGDERRRRRGCGGKHTDNSKRTVRCRRQ